MKAGHPFLGALLCGAWLMASCSDEPVLTASGGDASGADSAGDAAPDDDASPIDAGNETTGDAAEAGACTTGVLCGQSCVDTETNQQHCGGCDQACQGNETCCEGSCSTNCTLRITSVAPLFGPLSGNTWVTVAGEGFGVGAKAFVGGSRAPARVVDDQTMLILTPPGPQALVDIRVELGAETTTRLSAYSYSPRTLTGDWQKRDMSSARGNWPGISVLRSGRVLISGGVLNSAGNSVISTADVYDPATDTVEPTAGVMTAPRWTQISVTMLNEKVLLLGTWYGGYSPPSGPVADLFDPSTATFSSTQGQVGIEHWHPHGVLMADGRVLFVSGASSAVHIYDPDADSFSTVPGAPDCTGYRPVRLLDGNVLLVAGANSPTYLFDPETESITDVGPGPDALGGSVHTLVDGRVMVVGGTLPDLAAQQKYPTGVLEIWEPGANGFSALPYGLATPRQETLTTAMAGDGSILVLGGEVGNQVIGPACAINTFVITEGVERIFPDEGKVEPFPSLPEPNFVMSAATLHDGSVVAAGGAPCGNADAYPYFYFLEGRDPI